MLMMCSKKYLKRQRNLKTYSVQYGKLNSACSSDLVSDLKQKGGKEWERERK